VQNLFDFPGAPRLHEDGLDLRDMSRIDFSQFVAQLADADVVVCVSPDDSFVVLPPGESVMRAASDRMKLRYLVIRVANEPQADSLVGARMALAEGKMARTGAGAAALREFLIGVQDVPDGVH
jgi:hypothetical protein